MVRKGIIVAVLDGGRAVTVTPYAGSIVTVPITVPAYLAGKVAVGVAVAYVLFPDNTGILISRMDGGWN
jgi:hypothetical protein